MARLTMRIHEKTHDTSIHRSQKEDIVSAIDLNNENLNRRMKHTHEPLANRQDKVHLEIIKEFAKDPGVLNGCLAQMAHVCALIRLRAVGHRMRVNEFSAAHNAVKCVFNVHMGQSGATQGPMTWPFTAMHLLCHHLCARKITPFPNMFEAELTMSKGANCVACKEKIQGFDVKWWEEHRPNVIKELKRAVAECLSSETEWFDKSKTWAKLTKNKKRARNQVEFKLHPCADAPDQRNSRSPSKGSAKKARRR